MRSILLLLAIFTTIKAMPFELPDEKTFLNREIANVDVLTADGQWVKLFDLFNDKPVLISPIYTRCPKACSVITAGLQASVEQLGTLGKDFNIITFSFDHNDQVEDLQAFSKRWDFDNHHWRIVSSDSAGIQALLKSIDFQYDYDPTTKQYEHPNVVVMLSANKRIMQYLYGMRPKARDIRIAALNAKKEVSSLGIIEGFYLKCFQYDPATGTYNFDWSFLIEVIAGLLITGICSVLVYRAFLSSKNPQQASQLT